MSKLTRRQIMQAAVGVSTCAAGMPLLAKDYPNRPIRLVVPTPAGSGPDIDTRQVAEHMTSLLGQPIVVENKPGGGVRIASEYVSKATPDGYTLLVSTPSLITAPFLYDKLPFDAKRDFIPVSLLSETYLAMTINAKVPARTPAEYAALSHTRPDLANVGTYGIGTIPHLAAAWFETISKAAFNLVHYGAAPPYADLLSGQTQAIFDAVLPILGGVQAGRLRILAIAGKNRQPLLPDTPTFAEAGFGDYNPVVWTGVFAPTGTPAAAVKRLADAFSKAAKTPEVIARRQEGASQSIGSTPEFFRDYLEAEREKWGSVIRRMGLKLES